MPDIIEVPRLLSDDFIFIACDGIWEKYGDDSVKLTEELKQQLNHKKKLT